MFGSGLVKFDCDLTYMRSVDNKAAQLATAVRVGQVDEREPTHVVEKVDIRARRTYVTVRQFSLILHNAFHRRHVRAARARCAGGKY
jgi:hypothetical protein